MVEFLALVSAALGMFQLGRDIKAWLRSRRENGGKASWPKYEGWRAWVFPIGDALGVLSFTWALSFIVFHRQF